MQETYGTDAERRLGRKDKRVAARLSAAEVTLLTQVVNHLETPSSVWVRHAVMVMLEEGARVTTHDLLRARLLAFKREARAMGRVDQLVTARVPVRVLDGFNALLTNLAPSVKPALGLRWVLWEQGTRALAGPSRAFVLAAHEAARARAFAGAPVPSGPAVRVVDGYITEKDLT